MNEKLCTVKIDFLAEDMTRYTCPTCERGWSEQELLDGRVCTGRPFRFNTDAQAQRLIDQMRGKSQINKLIARAEYDALMKEHDTLRINYDTLRADYQGMVKEYNTRGLTIKQEREEIEALREALVQVQGANLKLVEERNSLLKRIEQVEAQRDELQLQVGEQRGALVELQVAHQALLEVRIDWEKSTDRDLLDARAEIDSLRQELFELEQPSLIRKERDALREDVENLQETLELTREYLRAAQADALSFARKAGEEADWRRKDTDTIKALREELAEEQEILEQIRDLLEGSV